MQTTVLLMLLATVPGELQVVSSGQSPQAENEQKADAAEAIRLARDEVARWEFRLGDDRKTKLTLHPEPLLRWSNPVDGIVFGDIYVWTSQGRPEVVVSIHNYFAPDRHMSDEFHSLSLEELVGVRDGETVWRPARPGVQFQPIPGAMTPADSPAQRLRQMRALAREFSSSLKDAEGATWQLRLLPRPVYRYESTGPNTLDGAMFAFTQGTDPEAWLLIEARPAEDGHQWQCAFARFDAKFEQQVRHKDRQIWEVPRLVPPWQNVFDPLKPYVLFTYR